MKRARVRHFLSLVIFYAEENDDQRAALSNFAAVGMSDRFQRCARIAQVENALICCEANCVSGITIRPEYQRPIFAAGNQCFPLRR